MGADLEKAVTLLSNEAYTCVLCRGETIYTATARGVKPLLEFLETDTDVHGFSAADRVVGNAAAFLYVLLGVREVYAHVISRAAADTLTAHGIAARYDVLAEYIVNRAGTGHCPMESAVAGITDPHTALSAIKARLEALQTNKG